MSSSCQACEDNDAPCGACMKRGRPDLYEVSPPPPYDPDAPHKGVLDDDVDALLFDLRKQLEDETKAENREKARLRKIQECVDIRAAINLKRCNRMETEKTIKRVKENCRK